MAQAAAGSSGMRLQPLAGAQLFSMYVGEGEAALRDAFQRARLSAPAIIFIDEIDAIVGVFPFTCAPCDVRTLLKYAGKSMPLCNAF